MEEVVVAPVVKEAAQKGAERAEDEDAAGVWANMGAELRTSPERKTNPRQRRR